MKSAGMGEGLKHSAGAGVASKVSAGLVDRPNLCITTYSEITSVNMQPSSCCHVQQVVTRARDDVIKAHGQPQSSGHDGGELKVSHFVWCQTIR